MLAIFDQEPKSQFWSKVENPFSIKSQMSNFDQLRDQYIWPTESKGIFDQKSIFDQRSNIHFDPFTLHLAHVTLTYALSYITGRQWN